MLGWLLFALTLPQGEIERFAALVAQTVNARAGATVQVRVEDVAGTGAADQLQSALREALKRRSLAAVMTADNAAPDIAIRLTLRAGQPLAVARVSVEGREAQVVFAEFTAGSEAPAPQAPTVTVRTRTLLSLDRPVLDVATDTAGNLFVLHGDRLRVFDLPAPATMKAETTVEIGAARLRDPLARLVVNENARQLEIYSAASSVGASVPADIAGYTVRVFPAGTPMRMGGAAVTMVAGRNWFRSKTMPVIPALAAVDGSGWVVLDGNGKLHLTTLEYRSLATASGDYGGDVAAVRLPCAGLLVLAASGDADPARDRIAILRETNRRLEPYLSQEIAGPVRRLHAIDPQRILAVAGSRVEEIELRCQ